MVKRVIPKRAKDCNITWIYGEESHATESYDKATTKIECYYEESLTTGTCGMGEMQ